MFVRFIINIEQGNTVWGENIPERRIVQQLPFYCFVFDLLRKPLVWLPVFNGTPILIKAFFSPLEFQQRY